MCQKITDGYCTTKNNKEALLLAFDQNNQAAALA